MLKLNVVQFAGINIAKGISKNLNFWWNN